MQEQFFLLLELQQVDDRMRALKAELEHLPAKLQAYETACVTAREALAQSQTTMEHSERQQRVLERDVLMQQDVIRKTQSKTYEVKTNKEYSAILAEIELGKQRLMALEDQLLALMETADQQRQAQQAQERLMQTATQALAAQTQQLQRAHELLQHDLTVEQARRQQTVTQLATDLYAQYQKAASQHGGRAVVQLHDGVCGGCYLKVQPQLISEIRMQTKLFTCPHCRSLLLWPLEKSQDEEDEMIAPRLQRGEESPGSIEQGAG